VVGGVTADFVASRGWGVVGGVFSDLVAARGLGLGSGGWSIFRFCGCAGAGEWWVEYFQIQWLREGWGVVGGVFSDFVAARGLGNGG